MSGWIRLLEPRSFRERTVPRILQPRAMASSRCQLEVSHSGGGALLDDNRDGATALSTPMTGADREVSRLDRVGREDQSRPELPPKRAALQPAQMAWEGRASPGRRESASGRPRRCLLRSPRSTRSRRSLFSGWRVRASRRSSALGTGRCPAEGPRGSALRPFSLGGAERREPPADPSPAAFGGFSATAATDFSAATWEGRASGWG